MRLLFVILRYAYPIMCVFLPCMIYQRVCYKKWTHGEALSKGRLAWRYVLILYLFLVLWAVGMGSIWDIMAYGLTINWEQINLVPFGSEAVMTYVLNIVLFMPLGFLLPLIWDRARRMRYTVLTGLFFSLAIEVGQLFNHRLTDIDDILMNVLGGVLGYLIWYGFDKRFQTPPMEARMFPDSPRAYIVLALLGSFFLENWRLTVWLFGGIAR